MARRRKLTTIPRATLNEAGRRKRRRTRTDHRGVKIIERKAYGTWTARWKDPDTEKWADISLTRLGLTTDAARRAWSIASGDTRARAVDLQMAVDAFLAAKALERRARTVEGLGVGLRAFLDWAAREGLRTTTDITSACLKAYRKHVASMTTRVPKAGGARGARRLTQVALSAQTRKSRLVRLGTFLHDARGAGLIDLSSDQIKDALGKFSVPQTAVVILRGGDVRKFLEALLRYGREERDADGAAFALVALLSGMRKGEIEALEWAQFDADGAGALRLDARTKTSRGRVVGFDVSPTLNALFAALQLRSGGRGQVFGCVSSRPLMDRLKGRYGAPASLTWQVLRRTCGSYLACAPGIYGGASAIMTASRLGHGVDVAVKFYFGAVLGLPHDAKTLEAAMGVESLAAEVVGLVQGGRSKGKRTRRHG